MNSSIRLGRIAGIPIGVNWSLLVIAGILTFSLATIQLPAVAPGLAAGAYWLTALGGAVLFFGSILAHELGHSVVAIRNGVPVRDITLWLLGGVAKLDKEADSPGAELRIAAAGPAVSVFLAFAFVGLAFLLASVGAPELLAEMSLWLGLINGVLAVFNMIPASPLDGGRILVAALWWKHGDRMRARVTGSRAGRIFGATLIAFGLFEWLFLRGPFGLFTAFMGWFLFTAAKAEVDYFQVRDNVSGRSVSDGMLPLGSAEDWMTVSALTATINPFDPPQAFAVRNYAREVVGVVTMGDISKVAMDRRDHVRLPEIMIPAKALMETSTQTQLDDLVTQLVQRRSPGALVVDSVGTPIGLVTTAALMAPGARQVRQPRQPV